jgi:hypothetical protein
MAVYEPISNNPEFFSRKDVTEEMVKQMGGGSTRDQIKGQIGILNDENKRRTGSIMGIEKVLV